MAKRKFHNGSEFWDWLEEVSGDRMNRRKVFEAGKNWAPLYDALQDAAAQGAPAGSTPPSPDDLVTIPRWALDAVLKELARPAISAKRTGKGKGHGPWLNRYRQDLVDWYRFQQVQFRNIGPAEADYPAMTPAEAQQARIAYRRQAERRGSEYVVRTDVPYPWKPNRAADDMDAFTAAASILKSSAAYSGQASTMKKSYEKVRAALKRGEFWRYYPSRWIQPKGHSMSIDNFKAK